MKILPLPMMLEDFTGVSEVKGIEAFLNLKVDNLIGFHKKVEEEKIKEMVELLKKGHSFPPVKVVKLMEHVYHMAFLIDEKTGHPDGGHHRAYAHFVAEKPLNVEIIDKKYMFPYPYTNIRNLMFRR